MSGGESFFVDTNVLLYSVDPVDVSKQRRATEWLYALWAAGKGHLSWQVLNEFYVNATGKLKMQPDQVRRFVNELSTWAPVGVSAGMVREAWKWTDEAQIGHWDALILAAAHRTGARYLLSEDFQGGRNYGGVVVVNPFEQAPETFFQLPTV